LIIPDRLVVLDLGCGENKIPNAIGLDNVALPGVDVVHDLMTFPYPFENQKFDKIYLCHVIEHFKIKDINKIFNECHRLLNRNGYLIITVPHVFSISAFIDPTHKSYFTFGSGGFWSKNNIKAYYTEINTSLQLVETDCRVNWFDWKRYRMRKLNNWFSKIIEVRIKKALINKNNPSLSDRIVKRGTFQLVEIKWVFKKLNT
tara:strand:- start:717 stop:1322 length:606 start_codon:yes stop_codon:yes gene_type:complete